MTTKMNSIVALGLVTLGLIIPQTVLAEQGDFIVRGRILGVLPTDDSGQIALNGAPIANSGVGVDEAATLELDVTYMVTNNIGVELIAGTANHKVELDGSAVIAGASDGFEIFDTWVLPPTVTAQWHFMPENNIRPYVGLGVNYTAFLSEDATNQLESAVGVPVSVNMDNSWGWAAQLGMDIDISERFFANIDVKYIDIDSTAKLKFAGNALQVDVDIDPIVVGVGVGMRF